ncbi:hypothetical protein HMPREF0063_10257 [Aeromicrobium marinum DSM 15272]|uniref:SdpI/YhfL protein family n=1 Tax=Aeromicrobium marinum DSM 15272 TaxID=585531 RepID=E2S8A0_9ACTN|nr:SdpI family protein [Aeromicrobium marinum]EFQ84405.1 hypothetical protein HMPREF0063_10257 [Aeromicrobium marinum DSM 15272]
MDPSATISLTAGLAMLAVLLQHLRCAVLDGHLGRNGAVGLRTRATRSSDRAWTAGHLAAAPRLRAAWISAAVGAAATVAAAGVQAAVGDRSPWALLPSGVAYAVVLGLVAAAGVTADRAARRIRDEE